MLILPDEKAGIEKLAESLKLKIKILPRIGTSDVADMKAPSKILAYQMMGVNDNGDVCPFLDTDSDKRSPHGGFACRIYEDRPLACRAYPLADIDPVTLDQSCKFCKDHKSADSNLESETEALLMIKESMCAGATTHVWRFATGTGDDGDMHEIMEPGWILDD